MILVGLETTLLVVNELNSRCEVVVVTLVQVPPAGLHPVLQYAAVLPQ